MFYERGRSTLFLYIKLGHNVRELDIEYNLRKLHFFFFFFFFLLYWSPPSLIDYPYYFQKHVLKILLYYLLGRGLNYFNCFLKSCRIKSNHIIMTTRSSWPHLRSIQPSHLLFSSLDSICATVVSQSCWCHLLCSQMPSSCCLFLVPPNPLPTLT
jgi:hypothetical protein